MGYVKEKQKMMKICKKCPPGFIFMTAAMSLCCGSALAGDKNESLGFNVSFDYFGKYIWRGQNVNDDPVFQPSISAGYADLTATIWGSFDLTNYNGNSGDFSELDYSLDYTSSLPGFQLVDFSIGVIYYDFPGSTIRDTTELYWGLVFDLPLNPSITVYHDVDEAEGSYVSLGLAHSIENIAELSPDCSVGIQISAGLGWGSGSYNKYYWSTDQSKMQDLRLALSFPMELRDGWTLAPNLNYVTLLSDDIRAADTYRTESDYFFAGLALSKDF